MTTRAVTVPARWRLVTLTGGPLDACLLHVNVDCTVILIPGRRGRYVDDPVADVWYWEHDA